MANSVLNDYQGAKTLKLLNNKKLITIVLFFTPKDER
jgi:hypothetical protein